MIVKAAGTDMSGEAMNGAESAPAARQAAKNNTAAAPGRQTEKKGTGTIFAGGLNLPGSDVENTRLGAQRKAMKVILDQHKNELEIDQAVSDRKEHQQKLKSILDEAAGEIRKLQERRQMLREGYGVEADSEEEKDVNALIKCFYDGESLTDEERKRVIDMGPLTEYQQEALKNAGMESTWRLRAEAAAKGIITDEKTITAIEQERLKSHAMVDAQKETGDILEASVKEIVDLLLKEGKERIDEEQEEKAEEAAQQAEKQDEKEKLEEEKRKLEEKLKEILKWLRASDSGVMPRRLAALYMDYAGGGAGRGNIQPEAMTELMEYAVKQNVYKEDLKGLQIDELL
ncbi:DNA repair exonuclease SbcCD ATPase subunit [Anaerotaenia torta]|uniref:hypothetical protein n=1 Tax=Anaerotaenia torta TaxID=433293 RepID=UPI003D23F318